MAEQKIFTRPNNEKEASEREISNFETSAICEFRRGKEVFIVERFPKKFFYYASKIRLEKVVEPIASLSAESNAMLYKVVSTSSIYE